MIDPKLSDELEEWRPIPGHEGRYEVSNRGVVRSWSKQKQGQALSPGRNRDGYLQVRLVKKTVCVHRLVLAAFVGPLPSGLVTRHLNGDRTDNRLSNLAYGTHSENARDAVAHGAHYEAAKTECSNGHPFSATNTYMRPEGARRCRECMRTRDRIRSSRMRGDSTFVLPTERVACPQGHPYDLENTYFKPNGTRDCRACKRTRGREQKTRRRARTYPI